MRLSVDKAAAKNLSIRLFNGGGYKKWTTDYKVKQPAPAFINKFSDKIYNSFELMKTHSEQYNETHAKWDWNLELSFILQTMEVGVM